MPITIRWPDSTHVLGPGFALWVHTDITGPVEVGSRFQIVIGPDPEGINAIMTMTFVAQQHDGFVQVGEPTVTDHATLQSAVQEGQPVHAITTLLDPRGGITDSGSETATWSPTAQLWQHVTTVGESAIGGGLTDQQALQLADTERRTQVLGEPSDLVVTTPSGSLPLTLATLFSRNTLDRLTLEELTHGPTCDAVRVSFSFFYYGVIVRVTTIDENLQPRTPDREWFFEDLAVLRIFRGADLQYRRGIHTPTFLTDQAWEFQWNIRNTLDALGVPPDNTLAVDWRPGCCGQVFLLKFPG